MSKRIGYYVIRKSKNKELYWQFWKNGREIARSSETYKTIAGVRKSIRAIQSSTLADVIDSRKK